MLHHFLFTRSVQWPSSIRPWKLAPISKTFSTSWSVVFSYLDLLIHHTLKFNFVWSILMSFFSKEFWTADSIDFISLDSQVYLNMNSNSFYIHSNDFDAMLDRSHFLNTENVHSAIIISVVNIERKEANIETFIPTLSWMDLISLDMKIRINFKMKRFFSVLGDAHGDRPLFHLPFGWLRILDWGGDIVLFI